MPYNLVGADSFNSALIEQNVRVSKLCYAYEFIAQGTFGEMTVCKKTYLITGTFICVLITASWSLR